VDVQLTLVKGTPRGTSLRLPPGRFLVGRGEECHVRASSALVSRQHCLFEVERESLLLRDLGSTNGTLVNGTRLEGACELKDGDLVQVGSMVLKVNIDPLAEPVADPKADTAVANDTFRDEAE